ncbi:hypothetical protein PRIPAC_76913 [Pristionchus pacificus]|uniref:G protein-coupled receptor n=1 Tax=Pristionchus pacificus TaxID=54126 RepID=A0A2A6BVU4_PRIPA|nr:hypothetical protein PRIPAC_76913 [Pristionchus pacificus]|eukprot:PDM69881.1 G protein-coupled receptor [Pristionchus pacificus]
MPSSEPPEISRTSAPSHYEWVGEAVVTVHGVYALIGTTLNCVLLYCMYRYTLPSFRVFGLLMKLSLLYISYGPCGLVSSGTCYVCYTLTLFVYVVTFYITLVSFMARLHIIKNGTITTQRAMLYLGCIASPAPLVFLISFLVSKSDDNVMIGIMKEKYPSYYQEGLIVTGNEYLLTVPMFLVMFIVTVLITPLYIVILKLRKSILNIVSQSNLTMSTRTKAMHTQFVHMLTLQAALPLVLILAVITFSFGQFKVLNHPALESASIIFGETPSLLSPIIVFYHIPAYRRAVKSMINGHVPTASEVSNPNSQERGPAPGTVITVRSNSIFKSP